MAEGDPKRWTAIALLVTGAAFLGLSPIGMRWSSQYAEIGPVATAFWRFLFSLPVLFLFLRFEPASAPFTSRDHRLILAAGVFFGAELSLYHIALAYTSVANATLLSNMTPIFATLAAWVLFRERPHLAFAIGAAIGVCGAGLLAYSRTNAAGAGGHWGGDAIALLSATGYAAYLLILGSLRQRFSATRLMIATTLVAMATAVIGSFMLGENFWPKPGWQSWGVLIMLGVIVHAGGQGLIAAGMGRLPMALSTVILWVQPLSAAALGYLLFGEALAPLGLMGAALLLAGVFIVQRAKTQ